MIQLSCKNDLAVWGNIWKNWATFYFITPVTLVEIQNLRKFVARESFFYL